MLEIDTPTSSDAPWLVMHGPHRAWYQRAALVGDFRPGRPPRPEYVVHSDGRAPDLGAPPLCEGCGQVPMVEDLELVERATNRGEFLRPYREGRQRWLEPTRDETCAWCNTPGMPLAVDAYVKLCFVCEAVLAGRIAPPQIVPTNLHRVR